MFALSSISLKIERVSKYFNLDLLVIQIVLFIFWFYDTRASLTLGLPHITFQVLESRG